MKRVVHVVLACAVVLAIGAIAVAQEPLVPVVRMGDWVEIGDEVFMNLVFSNTIYYRTTTNLDFEDRIQDRTNSNDPSSSTNRVRQGDHLASEARFGFDVRYQKNLTAQMLFEQENIFDGTNIDVDDDAVHVERFWVDYRFPDTPFRFRVGSWIQTLDIAGMWYDDDPAAYIFAEFGNLELRLSAQIEEESSRAGGQRPGFTGTQQVTNDNDEIRYEVALTYTTKPHKFGLYGVWHRDRFEEGEGQVENDYVVAALGWTGTLGPVTGWVQGNVGFGEARSDNPLAVRDSLDIFTWSAIAIAELNLGKIRPVVGVIVGSADDDPNDGDLNGFFSHVHAEISGTTVVTGWGVSEGAVIGGDDTISAPALAPVGGGHGGHHTVNSVFNDVLGNDAHPGYPGHSLSNPGTLSFVAGVKILPFKGHQLSLWYLYDAMLETDLLTALAPTDAAGNPLNYSKSLFHEIGFRWNWQVNKHFDIEPKGYIVIPADGAKDIASTVDCGGSPCEGEDIALVGQLQFRAIF
jgi:hypothetical protein